ncbi:uncharacterized protein LTR77_005542 [Saxophila tyrrhenica]|uniref:Uncharacterized protein n=1 Tax=Saxophila tyrrhenica TaxID=1690608 RepID=A0AAV9PB03_9PEZI|nr:hypothetical protein LTR77_005542 [Saxophila tyrrhenica]
MSNNTNWSSPRTLPPILNWPDYTNERDQLIKRCAAWRRRHMVITGAIVSRTPVRRFTEGRSLGGRRQLLVQADALATELSRRCGLRYAVLMASVVRDCLALKSAEREGMLAIWRHPPDEPERNRRRLMEAQLILALCLLISDLCHPHELNIPEGVQQAEHLMDRIEQSPNVRGHRDSLSVDGVRIESAALTTFATFRKQISGLEGDFNHVNANKTAIR